MDDTLSPQKSQNNILRLSPYQQASEHYACDHGETAIRYKTYSNGTRHYFEQCLNCGRAIGSAIAKKNITEIESILPWDNQTENAYRFLIDEMTNQLQLEKDQHHEVFSMTRQEEYHEYQTFGNPNETEY